MTKKSTKQILYETVRGNVAMLLKHRGWTMPALAKVLQMSAVTLYKRQRSPQTYTLQEIAIIAEWMGVSVAEMMEDPFAKKVRKDVG